jgi:hypothetical protein
MIGHTTTCGIRRERRELTAAQYFAARRQGREARRAGQKMDTNPHPAGTQKWMRWQDGWAEENNAPVRSH